MKFVVADPTATEDMEAAAQTFGFLCWEGWLRSRLPRGRVQSTP